MEPVVDRHVLRISRIFVEVCWKLAKTLLCLGIYLQLKIKVVGLEGSFKNSMLQLQSQFGLFDIRVVVNSVDLAAYKILERRAYAHVVVDGARGRESERCI